MHPHDMYVEPFVGGGAVFLTLQSLGILSEAEVWLCDADRDLIELYEAVRQTPLSVLAAARENADHLALLEEAERKDLYFFLRQLWNDDLHRHDGERHPGLQLMLRLATFNGLFRRNRRGRLNVPPRDTLADLALPTVAAILEFAAAIHGAQLRWTDFRDFAASIFVGPGALVYCDPPYHEKFSSYTADGFSLEDHAALIRQCTVWAQQGATVVYSNSATDGIRALLAEHWPTAQVDEVFAKRSISCDGNRDLAEELLVIQNGLK